MPKQEEMKGSFLQPRGDMGCLSLCLCPVVLIYQSGPRANISKRVPTSVFIRMRRNVTGLALRKPCSSQKPQLCISDRILRLSGLILGTSVTDTETDDGDLWPCYRGAVESQGRGRVFSSLFSGKQRPSAPSIAQWKERGGTSGRRDRYLRGNLH